MKRISFIFMLVLKQVLLKTEKLLLFSLKISLKA